MSPIYESLVKNAKPKWLKTNKKEIYAVKKIHTTKTSQLMYTKNS